MKNVLRTSGTVLRRLGAAVPDAWHNDRIFCWAAIGAVLTSLATVGGEMLDAHLEGLRAENRLHPIPGLPLPPGAAAQPLPDPTPSLPAVPGPVSQAVPRIAPGQPLDGGTTSPSPRTASDHFGVVLGPR